MITEIEKIKIICKLLNITCFGEYMYCCSDVDCGLEKECSKYCKKIDERNKVVVELRT